MSTRDAILIIRFLTSRPVIIGIVLLAIAGMAYSALGLDKAGAPKDLVCLGVQMYDLNDNDDKDELIGELVEMRSLPSQILQRPPCDMSGSRVMPDSLNKLYQR